MPVPEEQLVVARRRVRKFLRRADRALSGPISDLRKTAGNGHDLGFDLTWERQADGGYVFTEFRRPELDRRLLDSVVVDCRVFLLTTEDCYLPSVVSAHRTLLTPEQARARDALKAQVNGVIRDGRLIAPIMVAGRLEMDNGLGPGRLLGDDQITMDYINGVALHEDDERASRLENLSGQDSVLLAVLLQLNQLLHVVENVQAQIQHDLREGYFTVD